MSYRNLKIASLVLLSLVLPGTQSRAVTTLDLPEIGDSAGSVISPEFERRLGQAFMRQVRQQVKIVQDPEVESYIQSIGYQLVAQSDTNTQPFTFFIVDDPQINAFAAPGGVIGVNSGVILNSRTESELAAVMAHEIVHVTQRHMARTLEDAGKFSLPVAAAMVGAILLGTQSAEAGSAALAVISGASIQHQINFTRTNEEEADRVGMQLLARSDYDPRGMPAFFERLHQSSRYYRGQAPEFLQTHPLTTSRIAESISRAETYPRKKYSNSKSYELIRNKLQVYYYKSTNDAVRSFREKLTTGSQKDLDATRYGYALALIRADKFGEAREQLGILLRNDNENIAFLLVAAQLEIKQKNHAAALGIYKEAYKLYPDYRPLILAYSQTLLDTGHPQDARNLLRHYGQYQEQDFRYYNLLAQAEGQSGNQAESAIAKAEYFYLLGDTKLAIDKLRFTQRREKLDYYQDERISSRLTQLAYELELERELEL
jgi:predicted Zn-dependent protease